MLAYHNDPKLKKEILEQLQGSNLNLPVEQFENNLGIPQILAHLEDVIFEGLPNEEAKNWPIRFMSSINVGADLSAIWREFVVWLLIDPADGVIQYTTPGTEVYEVIIRVATLYRDGYTQQQMREAAVAAYDAVTKAAYTAAAAHAARTAYTAAAAHAAVYTAYAAATYVARDAVYTAYAAHAAHAAVDAYASVSADPTDCFFNNPAAFYMKMANKLIELLQKQEVKNVSLP